MSAQKQILKMSIDKARQSVFPVLEIDKAPLYLLEALERNILSMETGNASSTSSEEQILLDSLRRALDELECNLSGDSLKSNDLCAPEITYQNIELSRAASDLLQKAEELSFQDKIESSLNDCDYDLVFAVTLGAISSQLGQYIDNAASEMDKSPIYIVKKADQSLMSASDDLTKKLDGLDLFSIPANESKRTESQCKAWDKACNELGFVFGYDVAAGFLNDSDRRRTIDFDAIETAQEIGNNNKVIYRPFFREFVLLENRINSEKKSELCRYEQGKEVAWIFGVQVNLGLSNVSLENLPMEIQNRIRSIDPEKLFSLTQLFLNTTFFEVKDWPEVFLKNSEKCREGFKIFLTQFWGKVSKVVGNFTFGHSVHPKLSADEKKQYIASPTKFKYCIFPYLDAQGKPAKDKKELYTVNYIAICNDRPFPPLKPIRWNWVNETQRGLTHGALAIRASEVMKFAEAQFTNIIKKLLLKPIAVIKMEGHTASVRFDLPESKTPFFFNKTFLDTHYTKETGGIGSAEIITHYYLTAGIKHYMTEEKKAIIEFEIDMSYCFWAHTTKGPSGRKGDGRPYSKKVKCTLELNIGNYGNFGKLMVTPSVLQLPLSTEMHIEELTSLHVFQDSLNSAKEQLVVHIDNIVNIFAAEFMTLFNGRTCSWYVPGSPTAVYSDTSFSKGGDLVFNIRLED